MRSETSSLRWKATVHFLWNRKQWLVKEIESIYHGHNESVLASCLSHGQKSCFVIVLFHFWRQRTCTVVFSHGAAGPDRRAGRRKPHDNVLSSSLLHDICSHIVEFSSLPFTLCCRVFFFPLNTSSSPPSVHLTFMWQYSTNNYIFFPFCL